MNSVIVSTITMFLDTIVDTIVDTITLYNIQYTVRIHCTRIYVRLLRGVDCNNIVRYVECNCTSFLSCFCLSEGFAYAYFNLLYSILVGSFLFFFFLLG